MHQRLEDTSAMLVILELVEAGARRREQNDISCARSLRRDLDGALESPCALNGHAAINLACDFVGGRADQQRQNRSLPQRLLQRRIVASLILAAENHQNATR